MNDLLEFTTFSERGHYANGLALARRDGKTIEFYLDELATLAHRLSETSLGVEIGGFDWIFWWLLDQTIFHEFTSKFRNTSEMRLRKRRYQN